MHTQNRYGNTRTVYFFISTYGCGINKEISGYGNVIHQGQRLSEILAPALKSPHDRCVLFRFPLIKLNRITGVPPIELRILECGSDLEYLGVLSLEWAENPLDR